MVRVLAVAVVLGALACEQALPVPALTKKRADAIAVAASGARAGKKDVILFGLPRPLPRGSHVVAADPPTGAPGTRVRRKALTLTRASWLYWVDLDPYARFSHPSRLLVVDGETGRVTKRRLDWYPLVNGREPAFLASRRAYDSARYRVFVRERPLPSRRAWRPDAAAASTATIVPRLLEDDCVVMIGAYNTAGIAGDFPAMQKWASSVGLRAYYATRSGPSGSAPPAGTAPPDGEVLAANVRTVIETDRCTDVLIYMSGHGLREGKGPPTVFTGKTVEGADGAEPIVVHEGVDAADVALVIRAHPTIGFKVKIDSCFSGRFVESLTDPRLARLENLLIVEASSTATQYSYSALQAKRRTDNAQKVGEFTNQNLTGLRLWAQSEQEVASTAALGGSTFAHALERAFTLGRSANRAITARGAKPVLWVNPRPALEQLVLSHWHPRGSTTSFFCGTVTGHPGAAGTFTARGPAGFAFSVPFEVAADGRRSFNSRISRAGAYEVVAAAGGISLRKSYTVPPPNGPEKGPIDCSLFPRPG